MGAGSPNKTKQKQQKARLECNVCHFSKLFVILQFYLRIILWYYFPVENNYKMLYENF